MPDELGTQIERIRQLVDSFNIPRLEMDGYEADDVLGSVAYQAAARGLGVKIITGDRDLLQLVSNRIIVSQPGKSLSDSKDFLPEDVIEYFGVRPDQVVDYKALVGDKSDYIPGVAGIGEKTAASLLQQYESLDGIYAHLEEIKENLRLKLENGRQVAYLSQTLSRIVLDLNVAIRWMFEMEEAWHTDKGAIGFGADAEDANGIDHYPSIAGAYYAAKLGVAEYLARKKKQAGVLVLREIRPDYAVPVGVWQVREAIRAAMNKRPIMVDTLDQGINLVCKQMSISKNEWHSKGTILKMLKQKTITDYF